MDELLDKHDPEKINLDITNNLNALITTNELELITKNLLGIFYSNKMQCLLQYIEAFLRNCRTCTFYGF